MKYITAACKYFVSISLVAHIPNQLIVRRIEYVMQSNSKLYYTEACTKILDKLPVVKKNGDAMVSNTPALLQAATSMLS